MNVSKVDIQRNIKRIYLWNWHPLNSFLESKFHSSLKDAQEYELSWCWNDWLMDDAIIWVWYLWGPVINYTAYFFKLRVIIVKCTIILCTFKIEKENLMTILWQWLRNIDCKTHFNFRDTKVWKRCVSWTQLNMLDNTWIIECGRT